MYYKRITTGERFHAPEIQATPRTVAALIVLLISGGRIETPTAYQIRRERANAWREYAEKMQKEIDDERARGWGFRAIDGKRIQF